MKRLVVRGNFLYVFLLFYCIRKRVKVTWCYLFFIYAYNYRLVIVELFNFVHSAP